MVARGSKEIEEASDCERAERPKLSPAERDRTIAAYLNAAQAKPPPLWTGAGGSHRTNAPAYFQYPAMMCPAVQRDLLGLILQVAPESTSIVDPFCGSGTVLTEAMYQGLDVWVSDLSPLAVLICKVKSGTYDVPMLRERLNGVLARAKRDESRALETDLRSWRKWFRHKAAIQLSVLRRSIRKCTSIEARRFFWACLAETVRVTSNSRPSTYKLHVRAEEDIEKVPLPFDVFKRVAKENLEKHRGVSTHLASLKLRSKGRYSKKVEVRLHDARAAIPRTFDILMTSPPYGDNPSTVPYGQSAYLPLHWIDLSDIDDTASSGLLKSTHELDSRSLGGHRPRASEMKELDELRKRSPSLDWVCKELADEPPDRLSRVLGFIRDLDEVIPLLLSTVRVDGYLSWTVGNRRVGGREVPLSEILIELSLARSAVLVGRCLRKIPHKRMATRNSVSTTMRDEHLLVFRRVAAKGVTRNG